MNKRRRTWQILLLIIGLGINMGSISANAQHEMLPRESMIKRLERIKAQGQETGQEVSFEREQLKNLNAPPFEPKTNNVEEWLHYSLANSGFKYIKSSPTRYAVVADNSTPTPEPSQQASGKKGTLSGKVVDENGDELPGATIKVVELSQGTVTDISGQYRLYAPAGTYTIEIGYVGYQTQQVTGVKINEDKNTPLDIFMDTESTQLGEVVITATYDNTSASGILKLQQSKAEVSSVMSSQQISVLPDKNVGEVLKRLSGVSTVDNKKVIVRGMAERYNVAQLDGVNLPSTDVQDRDFEFNVIPSNLIDNIIVSKTYTPDMSFGFGGGLVQVNTMAIPAENFYNVSVGGKYANNATGKEFLGYGRGKFDFLAFDDGVRDHFPDDLFPVYRGTYDDKDLDDPNNTVTPDMIREQNKKIGDLSRIGTRRYTAYPGFNFSFSAGRVFDLGTEKGTIGLVGALSYRNEHNIDNIDNYNRGLFDKKQEYTFDSENNNIMVGQTGGSTYKFNTTWSALLNAGWRKGGHSISSRNLYSRMFDNSFERYIGTGESQGDNGGFYMYGKSMPFIREFDKPKFIDLLQNKLEGEHKLGNFTINWMLARSQIINNELDAITTYLMPGKFLYAHGVKDLNGEPQYYYDDDYSTYEYVINGYESITNIPTPTREQYFYNEKTYSAETSVAYQFDILKSRQIVKAGMQYLGKHGKFDWTSLPFEMYGTLRSMPTDGVPIWERSIDYKDPATDGFYAPNTYDGQRYEGKNANAAYFAMADNRIGRWARIVWGMRIESYEYTPIFQGARTGYFKEEPKEYKSLLIDKETGTIVSGNTDAVNDELKWRYLPSVSVTLTPIRNLNIRGSYSNSVVRPGLIENSQFSRYNSVWGVYQINEGMLSTQITHYDAKIEWFPRAGEVYSVGYFKKDFENPAEFYKTTQDASMQIYAFARNSKSAEVTGWEFDIRKNLEFLVDGESPVLRNLFFTGNLTLQKSSVQARDFKEKYLGKDYKETHYSYRDEELVDQKRALYGQVPLLYNLGLQYTGERLGMNVAYNFMDYKTHFTASLVYNIEFERERDQLDAQISYKFLKDKNLQVKLNMSNLLNTPYQYYINDGATVEVNKEGTPYLYGFNDRYQWGYLKEPMDPENPGRFRDKIGDLITYSKRTGVSFSFSASYSF